MDRETSIIYLASMGLVVLVGIAAMLGIPQWVTEQVQEYVEGKAAQTVVIVLVLILTGAVGLWLIP